MVQCVVAADSGWGGVMDCWHCQKVETRKLSIYSPIKWREEVNIWRPKIMKLLFLLTVLWKAPTHWRGYWGGRVSQTSSLFTHWSEMKCTSPVTKVCFFPWKVSCPIRLLSLSLSLPSRTQSNLPKSVPLQKPFYLPFVSRISHSSVFHNGFSLKAKLQVRLCFI